jgi:hypothetical protein
VQDLSFVVSKCGPLNRLYDWLTVCDPCQQSDVIFVLAGRECRKHFGLRLFREGWAPAILLSVGRFEIRRFSNLELPTSLDLLAMASTTEPRHRHYFVKVASRTAEAERIAINRFGTLGEVLAFSDWIRRHVHIRSATVVSSSFHLRRVRSCCRKLVPESTKLSFVAVPDESRDLREHWWRDPDARKQVLFEVLKIAVYNLLCRIRLARTRPRWPFRAASVRS